MGTIKSNIEISGKSLMDGKESIVKITPSDEKGIFFFPENSAKPIKACVENVISAQNFTVIGNSSGQIGLVEHFMAACAFSGIDSLNVYISSSELPILDGSALEWVKAFNNAGIESCIVNQPVEIKQPLHYSFNNVELVLVPAERFEISYLVNFNHPDLSHRWVNWNVNANHSDIIDARTFGYLKDLEKFQQAGLALGVSIDNTVGLTDTGYTTALRSQYEPAKHKILDLIGDLNLLGINPLNLKAHIIAKEAGHKFHVEFAKVIEKHLERV